MKLSPKKMVVSETNEPSNNLTGKLPRKKNNQNINAVESNKMITHNDVSEINPIVNDNLKLENDVHKKRKLGKEKSISNNNNKKVAKKESLETNENVKKHKKKEVKKTVNIENECVLETIENIKQEILDQDAEIRMKKMKDKIQLPNELVVKIEAIDSSDSSVDEPSSEQFSKSNKKKKTGDISDAENLEDIIFGDADQSVISEEAYFRQLSKCGLAVTWKLPELHKLIKHVTRHPDQEVRNEIEKLGLTYRTGHFTSEEDNIIKQNWSRLCEEYNLPNAPEIFARWRNTQNDLKLALARRTAIMYISQGLPHRTPVQIYYRFIHSLGKTAKGRFSEKEKKIIDMFYMTHKNNQHTQQFLANILGRDLPSVWRHLTRKKNVPVKKILWNIHLCEKLVRALLKIVRPSNDTTWNVNILLNRKISWSEWTMASKELDAQPLQLKVHWMSKLYVQLFSTQPVYLTDLRMKLLKIFIEKKFKHWQDISWKKVALHFKDMTTLFLWNVFHSFARVHCPSHILKDFRGVVDHLQERFAVDDQQSILNKKLSRFGMNSAGRLFVKYNSMN